MSELLVRKTTGALLGFKLGTKTGADVMVHLNALRKVNPGMAEDLEKKYIDLAKAKAKE